MKKWLTFLLLLITLTGTFYPCCLIDECSEDEITSAQNENKQKQEGTCSPFFACATCPGFAAMLKPIQIAQPLLESPIHSEAVIAFNLASYSASFWQPPRYS